MHQAGPGRPPSAITRFKRGNRVDDQSRELASATSGQSDSTIDTKFEPLNGLPTTSVAISAMARASCSSCNRYAGLTLTSTAPTRAAANWVTTHSGTFIDQIPICSPG